MSLERSIQITEVNATNELVHFLKPLPFKGGVGGGIWRSQFVPQAMLTHRHHPNPSSKEEGYNAGKTDF